MIKSYLQKKLKKKEKNLPTSNGGIERTNNIIFLLSETSMFNIRSEIIQPP